MPRGDASHLSAYFAHWNEEAGDGSHAPCVNRSSAFPGQPQQTMSRCNLTAHAQHKHRRGPTRLRRRSGLGAAVSEPLDRRVLVELESLLQVHDRSGFGTGPEVHLVDKRPDQLDPTALFVAGGSLRLT